MRVLEVISALDNGGVENLMYNYCSRIANDFQFDFTTYEKKKGVLEEKFQSIGSIVRLPQMKSNIFKTVLETKKCIKNGQYDIVHIHQGYLGFIALHYAKKYKVRNVIMHAHVAYVPESKGRFLLRRALTQYCLLRADHFMACSADAAKWMWGKRVSCKILKNAVVTKSFDYNVKYRETKRLELGIDSKTFVVGCVGRICYQKYPEFTLQVFKQVLTIRSNAILLMIGNGDQEEEMKLLAGEMGIADNVMFLGTRSDVPQLLNAMDVFLLPSRFEGLGIAYVEAQINGLMCFASKEGVPFEAKISDNMEFVSLYDSPEKWASIIIGKTRDSMRQGKVQEAIDAGYDIDVEAGNLASYYCSFH